MRRARLSDDVGSASLEFITVGVILLVPIVYLVLVLAQLQAGAFATEGAARQAARVYVRAGTVGDATEAVERAVEFALDDYGIDPEASTIDIRCTPADCLQREALVTVAVSTSVPLPLVPSLLSLDVPLAIPVSAEATQQVSRFWTPG